MIKSFNDWMIQFLVDEGAPRACNNVCYPAKFCGTRWRWTDEFFVAKNQEGANLLASRYMIELDVKSENVARGI